ncbi:Hint domain-containing protein [Paracoccus spongiarum]|uniref:Hint domain-containing protein n=1 Tax=Paracoccus spongiarum TaxID=3064387 RepID=A0ABT9J7B3_9RHOB|nr:Hint domain-containing protein [Paracoccus sp. 2205BS29-5]MDP5305666.1 Hint domain-containing protein [Paracoccus sp. 2205BS29-5]
MPTTWSAIYLGNGGAFNIDPVEGDFDSENAAGLVGQTRGTATDPLYEQIVTVTTFDRGGAAGSLDTNRAGNGFDQVQYTLPGATTSLISTFEGMGVYNAEVTFANGSTATVSAVIFQDEARNVFLAPELTANADSAAYQSGPIVSVTLTGLITNTSDLTTNRNGADFITCFTAGTLIDTPEGPRPVEDLRAGDLVLTGDRGAQVLRWAGSRSLDLQGRDHLRPVRIRAGALGQGLPVADLLVSPQHRVLVRSAIAQRMFGTDEVLVAARHLLALPGIEVAEDAAQVTYVHLLFDRHELVTSNGAVTESLFTGPEALKGVGEAARAEILALFPQLAGIGAEFEAFSPARPLVPGRQGRRLAARHLLNARPVVAPH